MDLMLVLKGMIIASILVVLTNGHGGGKDGVRVFY
jgi:hypothetical protein